MHDSATVRVLQVISAVICLPFCKGADLEAASIVQVVLHAELIPGHGRYILIKLQLVKCSVFIPDAIMNPASVTVFSIENINVHVRGIICILTDVIDDAVLVNSLSLAGYLVYDPLHSQFRRNIDPPGKISVLHQISCHEMIAGVGEYCKTGIAVCIILSKVIKKPAVIAFVGIVRIRASKIRNE